MTDFEDDPEALMAPLELIAQLGSDRALVKIGCRKKPVRPGRPARPSPEQARSLFTFLHMVFNFAVEHGGFGLTRNPIGHIRKVRRLGAAVRRDHTLTDEELAALMSPPIGCRHPTDGSIARWCCPGCDFVRRARLAMGRNRRRVVDRTAARMKGRNGTARPHVVPITRDLRKLFDSIPHGGSGDFIFSVNGGRTPVATGGLN